MFVGDWTADSDSLQTRPGACGRDYRVKSVVLVEVTFCAFPESVPDIVMANILARVPLNRRRRKGIPGSLTMRADRGFCLGGITRA